MTRPTPPRNNADYQSMKTEVTIVAGEEVREGVTIAKLLASTDQECRDYGLALTKFHASK